MPDTKKPIKSDISRYCRKSVIVNKILIAIAAICGAIFIKFCVILFQSPDPTAEVINIIARVGSGEHDIHFDRLRAAGVVPLRDDVPVGTEPSNAESDSEVRISALIRPSNF